jgi:hypothetical protein
MSKTTLQKHDASRDFASHNNQAATQGSVRIISRLLTKPVASSQPGVRGFYAGKKIIGRKRHALVDTCAFLLAMVIAGFLSGGAV